MNEGTTVREVELEHRLATPSDLDLLAEWNRQWIVDEGHRNPMSVTELRDRMESWIEGEYSAVLFEEEGMPVAYVLLRDDAEAMCIRQLFVDRDHRRRGVGRRVIDALVSEICTSHRRLVAEVLSGNGPGLAFWREVGFNDYAVTVELTRDAT